MPACLPVGKSVCLSVGKFVRVRVPVRVCGCPCECVCACVRACVRAFLRACVYPPVRAPPSPPPQNIPRQSPMAWHHLRKCSGQIAGHVRHKAPAIQWPNSTKKTPVGCEPPTAHPNCARETNRLTMPHHCGRATLLSRLSPPARHNNTYGHETAQMYDRAPTKICPTHNTYDNRTNTPI